MILSLAFIENRMSELKMKVKFNIKTFLNILEYLLIVGLILSSGSEFFSIFHATTTLIVWFVVGIIYFVIAGKKLKKKAFYTASIIVSILFFNLVMHIQYTIDYTFFLAMLLKLFMLLIISNSMTVDKFKKIFTEIMFFEAVISIICFVLITIVKVDVLPYQEEIQVIKQSGNGYDIIYLTPYYTVGALSSGGNYIRNSGIFVESPMHQIFLNLALLFTMEGFSGIGKKKRNMFIIIFVLSIISTRSMGGYLVFMCVIAWYLFCSNRAVSNIRNKLIAFFLAVCFLLYNLMISGTFDRLIYGTGTMITRTNDTLGAFRMSLLHPIIGDGAFNEHHVSAELYGVTTGSNGLMSLLYYYGYPIIALYLIRILYVVKKHFKKNMLWMVLFGILLLTLFVEPIGQYPIYLIFLFGWENGGVINDSLNHSNNSASN